MLHLAAEPCGRPVASSMYHIIFIKTENIAVDERTYNDKAYTSPHLFRQFFNFRISIKFVINEVKKTSKFEGSGLYLHNKYQ